MSSTLPCPPAVRFVKVVPNATFPPALLAFPHRVLFESAVVALLQFRMEADEELRFRSSSRCLLTVGHGHLLLQGPHRAMTMTIADHECLEPWAAWELCALTGIDLTLLVAKPST